MKDSDIALWQVECTVNSRHHAWWVISDGAEGAMGCVRAMHPDKEVQFQSVQKRNKFGKVVMDIRVLEHMLVAGAANPEVGKALGLVPEEADPFA